MSKKNLEELRKFSKSELKERLEGLKSSLYQLRMQLKMGQLKNISSIGEARKDIARIMTLMRQK